MNHFWFYKVGLDYFHFSLHLDCDFELFWVLKLDSQWTWCVFSSLPSLADVKSSEVGHRGRAKGKLGDPVICLYLSCLEWEERFPFLIYIYILHLILIFYRIFSKHRNWLAVNPSAWTSTLPQEYHGYFSLYRVKCPNYYSYWLPLVFLSPPMILLGWTGQGQYGEADILCPVSSRETGPYRGLPVWEAVTGCGPA